MVKYISSTMKKETRLALIAKLCAKPIGLFAPSAEDVREEISLVSIEREEREENDSPFASPEMVATEDTSKEKTREADYLLTPAEKKFLARERQTQI